MPLVPPWMDVLESIRGTEEAPGSANNPVIMRWAKIVSDGVASGYPNDATPWCGLAAAFVVAEVGIPPADEPLWAKNWASWGRKLSTPAFGCVIVFTRGEGGHVAFYLSEDDDYYHIAGGNQSDAVNVTRFAKSKAIAFRWPEGKEFDKFLSPGRIKAKFDPKAPMNKNDAREAGIGG